MANPRLLLHACLVVPLLLGLFGKPVFAAPQPQIPDPPDMGWEYNQTIPDTYQQLAENKTYVLYANAETLAFKVIDKRSGYIWHSNLDEKGEDDRLNRTWTAFAVSGISIDYMDLKATEDRASITNADHTIDFQPDEQGFQAVVTFTEPSISVTVRVHLEDAGVRVEIPFEGITQADANYRLSLLYVYPFFGATRTDQIPGYMFLPDGSGSLVHFTATTKATNMFYGRYYGDDLGMLTMVPFDPLVNRAFRLSIPVLGMVHGENQNGYIAIVEKGASYGELHLHPAGVTTNFHFLYNAFVYNESFYQATNRSGAGVTTLQRQTNRFDVLLHYRFLTAEESNYVGMARNYRQYLLDSGKISPHIDADGKMGIRLEFIGGERERVLLWNRTIPMTTVAQIREILATLQVQDPEIIYYGWQPHGASAMPPTTAKIDPAFGSAADLRALAEEITAAGGKFSLYYDPQAALEQEKGYSPRRDLAMSITNSNLMGFNRFRVNNYFNWDALHTRLESLNTTAGRNLGVGLALDGIGATLYADFKPGHLLNREDTIAAYQTLLGGVQPAALYRPNDYLFPALSSYYDVPLSSSGYLYTDEVIPFLQIVLSGLVPMYGPALNFSSDIQADLLAHADFGVAPSFYLSYEQTAKIMNTPTSWIYSSSYVQWGEEVNRAYQWLNALLGPVAGQEIIARQTLQSGVVATTYANGKQIIVNYNALPYSAGNVTVEGRNAAIVEVVP